MRRPEIPGPRSSIHRSSPRGIGIPIRRCRPSGGIEVTNGLMANLRIENAILRSQTEEKRKLVLAPLRRALPRLAVVVGAAVLWFMTENVGLMLFFGVLALLVLGVVRLIDTIKPGGNDRRPPPYLPGGT